MPKQHSHEQEILRERKQALVAQTVQFLGEMLPKAKNMAVMSAGLSRAFPKGCVTKTDEDGYITGVGLVPDDTATIEELLADAGTSTEAFDAVLAWGYAHLLNSGHIPHGEAARFLALHFTGSKQRPSKQGRLGKEYHADRDAILRLAVAKLEERGFKPNKNSQPSSRTSDRTSACEIVAEAMQQLGRIPQSAKTIERIVRDGDRVHFS